MAEESTKLYNEINVEDWSYEDPKRNSNNGLNVFVRENSNSRSSPIFQLERSRAPFGVNDGYVKPGEAPRAPSSKKNLTLSVDNKEVQQFLKAMDARQVRWVAQNSKRLFNREMSEDMVNILYNHTLKELSAEKAELGYAPLFKIKVQTEGKYATKVMVVNQAGNAFHWGSYLDIVPNCDVIPRVRVTGLWFANNACGSMLTATHLVVYPPAEMKANPIRGLQNLKCVETPAAVAASTAHEEETLNDGYGYENISMDE